MSRSRKAILAACAATLVVVPNAWATHTDKPSPRDRDAKEFVSDVPVSRIVHHQYKLQEIARANGDTRTVLSGGYTDSLEYVKSTLRRAGYSPKTIDFNFPFWEETAPAVLSQVTPTPTDVPLRHGEDDGQRGRRLHHARLLGHRVARQRPGRPDQRHRDPAARRGRVVDERLRGDGLPGLGGGQGRARHARHVRVRREGRDGAAGRRRGHNHLQRRRRRRAPEPDLRRRPGRPDDPGRDRQPRGRQGAL